MDSATPARSGTDPVALGLGLLASLFFSVTFLLNRSMGLQGGHWIWSAVLRYAFLLPMAWALLLPGRRYRPVLASLRGRPGLWLAGSTIGFGLFYAPLCASSVLGPAWLTAGAWQLTIPAGILLTPLFCAPGQDRHPVPRVQLAAALVIAAGVALTQWGSDLPLEGALPALGLILVAAFAYPAGNRLMLSRLEGHIDTPGRVAGMTLASMPFWLVLALVALAMGVYPSPSQIFQSFLVALSSGLVATLLFFAATARVRGNPAGMAMVESTQAGEVLCSLLGGLVLLGDPLPGPLALAGLGVVGAGMVFQACTSASRPGGS